MEKKDATKKDKTDAWQELAKYVGPAIHVARVRRNITQEQLAKVLSERLQQEVRQSYVSKIEKGYSSPSLERLGIICIALGCPPDHVMKIARFLAENEGRHDEALLAEILPDDASGPVRATSR